MLINPNHVCLIINRTQPDSLGTPPDSLCHARGNTWYSFGTSRYHHPCPHSALDPLTPRGNVYPNFSLWQQVHDGALKEKVQSVLVRGKMRREGEGWGGVYIITQRVSLHWFRLVPDPSPSFMRLLLSSIQHLISTPLLVRSNFFLSHFLFFFLFFPPSFSFCLYSFHIFSYFFPSYFLW